MLQFKQAIQELENDGTRRLFLRRVYNHVLQGGAIKDMLPQASEEEKPILNKLKRRRDNENDDAPAKRLKMTKTQLYQRFKKCMIEYKNYYFHLPRLEKSLEYWKKTKMESSYRDAQKKYIKYRIGLEEFTT